MSLKSFLRRLDSEQHSKTLFVTHVSREDLVLGFVAHSELHHDIWVRSFVHWSVELAQFTRVMLFLNRELSLCDSLTFREGHGMPE